MKPLLIGDLNELPHAMLEHPLVLVRGAIAPERDEFLRFCEAFRGFRPLHWSFGPVMEMKESADPQNYLFSREEVPFHWDGAFHQVPDFLVFSCVDAPGSGAGGETLFTNTEKIWHEASAEERTRWSKATLRYETEKLAHYGGAVEGALVQSHPRSGRPILRFAEPVHTRLNPVALTVRGASDVLVKELQTRIYDPRYCYRHEWQAGDLLIADNHTLIHGRTAFQKNVPRHLRRIQLIQGKPS